MTKEKNKSEDILYVSDYILENFSNHGDSGELYLATNKKDPSEKYILKYQHYDCACNEFRNKIWSKHSTSKIIYCK